MSSEESRRRSILATSDFLFAQYDQDHDGFIDQFEFSTFLWDLREMSGRSLAKKQAMKCWDAVDMGRTCQLDLLAFRVAMDILWENDFFDEQFEGLTGDAPWLGTPLTDRPRFSRLPVQDEETESEPEEEHRGIDSPLTEDEGPSSGTGAAHKEATLSEASQTSPTLPQIQILASSRENLADHGTSSPPEDAKVSSHLAPAFAHDLKRAQSLKIFKEHQDSKIARKKSLKSTQEDAEAGLSIPSNHQRALSEDGAIHSSDKNTLVKIFRNGDEGAYKTFIVNQDTAADTFLQQVFDKFQIPEEEYPSLDLFEVLPSGEFRSISPSSPLSAVNFEKHKIFLQSKLLGSNSLKKKKTRIFARKGNLFA